MGLRLGFCRHVTKGQGFLACVVTGEAVVQVNELCSSQSRGVRGPKIDRKLRED